MPVSRRTKRKRKLSRVFVPAERMLKHNPLGITILKRKFDKSFSKTTLILIKHLQPH